jgi:hypothetical protein
MKMIPLPIVSVKLDRWGPEEGGPYYDYDHFNVTINGYVVGNWDELAGATAQARGIRRALRASATRARAVRGPAAGGSRR